MSKLKRLFNLPRPLLFLVLVAVAIGTVFLMLVDNVRVMFMRRSTCPACHGTGDIGGHVIGCPYCGGEG